MSAEEKNKYKSLAREFNLKNGKPKPLNQIHNLRNNSFNYWKMHENLIDMFENIKDNQRKNNMYIYWGGGYMEILY